MINGQHQRMINIRIAIVERMVNNVNYARNIFGQILNRQQVRAQNARMQPLLNELFNLANGGNVPQYLTNAGPINADAMNNCARALLQERVQSWGEFIKDELIEGAVNVVKAPLNMVLHPINTAKGLWHAVCHPIDTVGAVCNEWKNHPIRETTTLLGNMVVGGVVGKVLGSVKTVGKTAEVAQKAQKVSQTVGKTSAFVQLAENVPEGAVLAERSMSAMSLSGGSGLFFDAGSCVSGWGGGTMKSVSRVGVGRGVEMVKNVMISGVKTGMTTSTVTVTSEGLGVGLGAVEVLISETANKKKGGSEKRNTDADSNQVEIDPGAEQELFKTFCEEIGKELNKEGEQFSEEEIRLLESLRLPIVETMLSEMEGSFNLSPM